MGALVILVLGLVLGYAVDAAPVDEEIPPRPPTATPRVATMTPDPRRETSKSDIEPSDGARITLSLQGPVPTPDGLWAVVQWQDAQEGWHDVEGWRGSLNNKRQMRWWVSPTDFGRGPFRWIVYAEPNSSVVIGSSDFFNLPTESGDTMVVPVFLDK
jgi:hypothetical protein